MFFKKTYACEPRIIDKRYIYDTTVYDRLSVLVEHRNSKYIKQKEILIHETAMRICSIPDLYIPGYASFLESILLLKLNMIMYDDGPIKKAKKYLKRLKNYIEPKFYQRFSYVLITILKLSVFCVWSDYFTFDCWAVCDVGVKQGLMFGHYVLWNDIGRLCSNTMSGCAFENKVKSYYYHKSLWNMLEESIRHIYLVDFYDTCKVILKSTMPAHTIFLKHRLITNACKRFVRKVARQSNDLVSKQTRKEFGVLQIDEITWDITFPYKQLLDMINVEM